MRRARHRHDTVGQSLFQQPGECEVSQVIGANLHLESVDGPTERHSHDTGIVHQHVHGVDRFGEGAN